MKLDVQVISEEIVKPSSPTADRLRRYELSFLDQLTPSLYNALVYFYPKTYNTEDDKIPITDGMKHSISNVLTYFYPLAGRLIEDQLFVDCNDEGIPFVEARVNCQLAGVLNNPVLKELNKLLPFEIQAHNDILLGIQFNVFECGGVGIGVCVSHKIGDALSFFSFVKMWAAIARGETILASPEFESASLFPPRDLSGFTPTISQLKKEQIITKRFVFGRTQVEEIRRKYGGDNGNQTRPTRVEALSAFLWDRLITAIGVRSKPDKLYTIVHMVNIRGRTEPPLPESSFGNLYSFAQTIPSVDSNIVTQMRDSIKAVNKESVKKIQDGYNHLDSFTEITTNYAKGREMVFLTFTSLCRFPLYEADFGWGKPVWAGSGDREIKNVVAFLDTVTGDGIEAWVTLNEEEMAKFDSDVELLASIDALKSLSIY